MGYWTLLSREQLVSISEVSRQRRTTSKGPLLTGCTAFSLEMHYDTNEMTGPREPAPGGEGVNLARFHHTPLRAPFIFNTLSSLQNFYKNNSAARTSLPLSHQLVRSSSTLSPDCRHTRANPGHHSQGYPHATHLVHQFSSQLLDPKTCLRRLSHKTGNTDVSARLLK